MNLQSYLDNQVLTPIVRKLIGDQELTVSSWAHTAVTGGTMGEVYHLCGNAETPSKQEIPWSLVLKIQEPYVRLGDPESWQREKFLYQSDFFLRLPKSLRVPDCLQITHHDNLIWLWLAQAEGVHGDKIELTHYGLAARHLGHMQGMFLSEDSLPDYSWLSTRYWQWKNVADWGTGAVIWLSKQSSNEIASSFSPSLQKRIWQLWNKRDRLQALLHDLPLTIVHRDYASGNIFVVSDHTTVIDWDCAGIGTIGEDIGDLVGEALVFDGFPITKVQKLADTVFTNHLAGLREAGWRGDEQQLRQGFVVNMALHWCLRIVCRLADTDDTETQERYAQIQEWLLDRVEEIDQG